MNIQNRNDHNAFTGLKNTTTLQRAKEYALNNGEKRLFNIMKKTIDRYSTDNLVISIRENTRPKCLHITVANRRDNNRLINGVDYSTDSLKDMGEVAFFIKTTL